jgi:hypothetical protein
MSEKTKIELKSQDCFRSPVENFVMFLAVDNG